MPDPSQERSFPDFFLENVHGHYRSGALKAAIELDLFTAIAEGAQTAAELASRCGATERGVRILCDYLVVAGFLTKQDGRYGLPEEAAKYLDRRSPTYIGTTIRFLLSPTMLSAFQNITGAVRAGGTVIGEDGTVSPENPIWVDFARGMAPVMRPPANTLAELLNASAGENWKVLDIAAGHGLFGITLARHNPNAKVVAVDWKQVLEVAQENARKEGVADRYETLPGSAFEVDFGQGYDIVLLTNFLHHFDPAANEEFLRKVHGALAPGGRAVTLEFIPNEDRVSPPNVATFSFTMLGTTSRGDAYTFPEFEAMFRNAGFSRNELHPAPPSPQSAVISYK